jgi:filamentous hemagglutinin
MTYSPITNPESIYGKLTQYVDAAANYTPRASIDVDPSLIRTKTIQLAVPEYTSAEQWQYISRAVQYGRQQGVSVIVTRIKSTS